MIQALPKAKELWEDPQDLITMWKSDPHKTRHEILINRYIGPAGYLVDLGCGVGRFSLVLNYTQYQGYDQSTEMIRFARDYSRAKNVKFSCIDVFQFVSDDEYDTLIMIDVAHHQEDPLDAIEWVLNNWKAKRYFFTIITGDKDESLYNSSVVSEKRFEEFAVYKNIKTLYNEIHEHCWKILSYDSNSR